MKVKPTRRLSGHGDTARMVRTIDKLAEFDSFCVEVAPALRRDLSNGLDAKGILKKYKSVAAARLVTLTSNTDYPAVALAASKDILDRADGRATEKKEITHRMQSLSEQELDAILLTEISDQNYAVVEDDPPLIDAPKKK